MKRIIRKVYIYIKHLFITIKLNFAKPQFNSKIFCIGYNKTGTSSLGKALASLGYNHSSYNKIVWKKYYKQNKISKVLNFTAKFDSVDDLPWLKEDMIPILDEAFPHSKFIYLTREENAWKKSLNNWTFDRFGKYPDIEQSWIDFKKHEKFVLEYFKKRKDKDFIILDIKDPEGLKKLAKFLGKKTDNDFFPHFNKSK